MAREGRSILGMIFKNFVQSLKPRQIKGNLIGSDYLGNKYYEIPANPSIGKRKPSRWFEPKDEDNFEQEMPSEWESWLRGRRAVPPSENEIMENVAIMKLKKENAAKLALEFSPKPSGLLEKEKRGKESFPEYPEYEVTPGDSKKTL